MPILRNVLGLDLGSHSLKAVEFEQGFRGPEAVQVQRLVRGDSEEPLAELVRHFTSLHKLTTEHVVTALPGDRISARRLQFPFTERRKLAAAIPFEVESDLPFDVDDVVIDWEVVGGDKVRTEVVASVVPRGVVSELLETLREAGCEPRTLEADGLVLGNLAAVFDLGGNRLLVDLGHRKSTMCLMIDGHPVAARTIPIGGLALTKAIAKDRGLSLDDAESYKCEERIFDVRSGITTPPAVAVLDRIAQEIVRTLGSNEPVLAAAGATAVSEITIFGGTAQADGIDEHLAERIGVPTVRLGLPIEGQGNGLVAGGPPILFAPTIALALRGTSQARTKMNFRRDEFAMRVDVGRYARDFGATGALAVVAAILGVVSFLTGTWLESNRADALESHVAMLFNDVFPGRDVPTNAVGAMREEVRRATERAEFLGVYRGNLSALDLLSEISKRVPEDLEIVFEEVSIDRQIVRMRVLGKSFGAADRLGAELAKFPPFSQTRIGSIEDDPKSKRKRFNVTISLSDPEDA